jgi:hypothetical protein
MADLSGEIGTTAGKIHTELSKAKAGKDIAELKRIIKADEAYLHMALGWLAREDKITIDKGKTITAKLK